MRCAYALSILFCTILSFHLRAQKPCFGNLNENKEYRSSTIHKVAEDSLGYIWMVGIEGIKRYDGTSFRQYGYSDGLTERSFYFVARIPQSNSLLFISNTFKVFLYEKGRFTLISSSQPIAWITFDDRHVPYFMARWGDIYTLNGNRLISYSKSRQQRRTYYHFVWINSNRFLMSHTGGIECINPANIRIQLITESGSDKEHLTARIFKLNNGRIFVSNIHGIQEFNSKESSLKCIYPFRSFHELYCSGTFGDDILFGSSKGLLSFHKGVIQPNNINYLLTNTQVFDLFKTSEGIYFFSTNTDGVYMSMLSSLVYGQKEGLDNPDILFVQNEGKDVYAFSDKADIYLRKENKFERFNPGPLFNQPNIVRFVHSQRNGLWVGYKVNTNRIMVIRNRKTYTFYKDAVIPWMIAHVDDAPSYFDKGNSTELGLMLNLRFLRTARPFAKNNFVNPTSTILLLVDRTRNRYYYRKERGVFYQDLNHSPNSMVSIDLGTDAETLFKLNDTILVAGTLDKGIAFIRNNSPTFISEREGLSGNHCHKLIKKGNELWALTEKGLSRITLTAAMEVKTICNFQKNNILTDDLLNDFCIVDDTVYVATKQGVVTFPRKLSFSNQLPKVNITGFFINQIDTTVAAKYELPFDMNNIAVTYKCMSLLNAGKTTYRYLLLQGSDTLTINTTTDEKLQFLSLASGEYVLQLSAMSENGVWSKQPTVIRFQIYPVFWKTWWFISLASVALVGIIIAAFLYKLNVNRKTSLIQTQLIDSELKALRLHMNPHFIFNVLNGIQRYILKYDPLTANKHIADLSQLMRWVMTYSDKKQISLQEEFDFLALYIELEQIRFDQSFTYKLHTDAGLETHSIFIPPLVIQPFVENAIKYGLSSRLGGNLQITVVEQVDCIKVSVTDDGVGREQVKLEQIQSGRKTISTGIRYTEERLRLISGIQNSNPVVITDLYKNGQPAGTQVDITIPILT